MAHIMTWNHGAVTITGPFRNEPEAIAWAKGWQEGAGDNPCWQLLSVTPSVRFVPAPEVV